MSRLMLAALTVFALSPVATARAAPTEAQALEYLKIIGGKVTRDETLPDKPVIGVDVADTKVVNAGLKLLEAFKSLTTLSVRNTTVNYTGFENISRLTSLTKLDLSETKMTDAALKTLAPLSDLTNLNLRSTLVTDRGLKNLAALKNLTTLDLRDTKVTNKGLDELKAIEKLGSLDLEKLPITDDGLKSLAACKNLTTLNLIGTRVTAKGLNNLSGLKFKSLHFPDKEKGDLGLKHYIALTELHIELDLSKWPLTDDGVKELAGQSQLTKLNLAGTGTTDKGAKELAKLGKLTKLNLSKTGITDETLKELVVLTDLTELRIAGAEVTPAAARQLRAALPKCVIVADVKAKDLEWLASLEGLRLELLNDKRELSRLRVLIFSSKGKLQLLVFDLDKGGAGAFGGFLEPGERVSGLSGVYCVENGDVKITDEHVKTIATNFLVSWTALGLGSKNITDTALKHVSGMPLKTLYLETPQITDIGLKEIAKLTDLTELGLHDCEKVTLVGLSELAALKKLQKLSLRGTGVTDDGVKALQKLLPKCDITK